ncbi:hypothetical protein [Sphingomonas sp. SRS2]|uniref:hypothetical protein n=1 Tax=Sphingomonas sp. SRS2 TaxID=133190 RepID=UPI0006184695|nr:hypothetical protein [Sphingomonas sp. SRS2]KKC24892.1 hypothetical protein WP12_16830 [Sphingomonas sp. SRS2]
MRTAVRWYRVTCFGKPSAPWRDDREHARRDAIELGLGAYDEWGQWFTIVPGGMEKVFSIEEQAA